MNDALLDEYLRNWDLFAQGRNDLTPYLNANRGLFEKALAAQLLAANPEAPARLVFYAVVQVGGFVPYNSVLGEACASFFGSALHPKETGGQLSYFAGDLYTWWLGAEARCSGYPLLTEWLGRPFVRTVVLPLYARLAAAGSGPPPGSE
jgi:hypothetical protein